MIRLMAAGPYRPYLGPAGIVEVMIGVSEGSRDAAST
jgi:hypothetical protein